MLNFSLNQVLSLRVHFPLLYILYHRAANLSIPF
nr:MAG TPA: hypothetical protein [Caudoviricetes sp.]